ncbi:hypothetical protein [Mesobacterium pallidum]|uniref:hypothetical protein n=1 Tax=Mesobacterium pallidum TaxID=2872037 RepID=UPI001EE1E18F|nr:hypothetical protein [Mesobacterium pallidum]
MTKLDLMEAAEMIRASYAGTNAAEVDVSIDIRGVQAHYLKSGVLVIPGTNEFADWFDFNLNVTSDGAETHGFEVVPGDSGTLWHAGFLEHAQIVYTFAKGLRPKFIVGHSLGAASAQIVGCSLQVPTVAFASPQVCRSRNRLPGEGWVMNLCRADDTVCHVPPRFLGFRTIGSRYWLSPDEVNVGGDHKVENYMDMLKLKKVKDRVPMAWPA